MSVLRYFSYIIALALLGIAPATAAAVITTERADFGVIALSVPYLEDQTQSNSAVQAAVETSRLQQAGKLTSSAQIKFGPKAGTFWIALNLANNSTTEQWWFDLQPVIGNMASPVRSMALYDPEDPQQKPLATWPENASNARKASLPLTLKSGTTVTRYVMVQTWQGMNTMLAPQLKTQTYMDQHSTQAAQKAGILWLMIGAVFGIGLIQLLSTRHPVQGALALNALIVGTGIFLSMRSELVPNIAAHHPVLLPTVIAAAFGLTASLLLWIAARGTSSKASLCLVPALLNIVLAALAVADINVLAGTGLPLESLPHYLLTLTGLILFGITVTAGLSNVSLYWFIPAWLTLAALPWLGTHYPYASPIAYVVFLGIAGTASVFWFWKSLGEETESLQRRLRSELKTIKDKFQEEDANWQKKMETQRILLNELRAVEQQRSAELEIAKKEADTANKAKSDFLAIIGHEIRTPMNGIMGILQVLNETSLDNKQREYIDVIKNSGDTMVTLLNDILDYSKIEKGVIDLEMIPFSLHKLVQSVATLMSGRAKDKGVSINVDIAGNVPEMLKGDPGRIRQILLNLASNAVKFTEKGSVTLRVTSLDDKPEQLRFEVIDTGIGISEEAQSKLFTAYVQADASISRRFGGTGLGLNICRMLVNAMNGQIGMTSVEGTGSTFWFELPLEIAEATEPEVKKEFDANYVTPRKVSALVVDDNDINLKIVSSLLEMDGHQVVLANSGDKALMQIEQQEFDVVFVDIMMPGMDGKTFLKKLRGNRNRHYHMVPVFALTGMLDPESVKDMLASGIMDVIGKPVTKQALREAIQKVAGNSAPLPRQASIDDLISQMQNLPDRDKERLRAALGGDVLPVAKAVETPVESLLNMTILGELKASLPPETLQEIFVDLIAKSKELALHMAEAEHDRNFEEVGTKAHNLRGMAGNFGLQALMEHAAKVEQAVRSGDNEKATILVKEGRLVLDHSLSALDRWMKS